MARIVVAEDEHLIRAMIRQILQSAGHDVTEAANGAQALDCVLVVHPDLVITDFTMPVMTGLDLARSMQGNLRTAHIPILLVTGEQPKVTTPHQTLFAGIVGKPFTHGQLLGAVTRLLAG